MAGEKLFDKLQRKVHTMKSKKNMKKTKSTKREAKETVGDSEETVRGDAGKKLELLDFSSLVKVGSNWLRSAGEGKGRRVEWHREEGTKTTVKKKPQTWQCCALFRRLSLYYAKSNSGTISVVYFSPFSLFPSPSPLFSHPLLRMLCRNVGVQFSIIQFSARLSSLTERRER